MIWKYAEIAENESTNVSKRQQPAILRKIIMTYCIEKYYFYRQYFICLNIEAEQRAESYLNGM